MNAPTIIDTQLSILFRGLEQIHPAVAARLRASFAQQVAALDETSADYEQLVRDLVTALRGVFVAEMHADRMFTGTPFTEGK